MTYKRLRAFTLVELLVVITVIMIMTTFTILTLGSARSKAKDNKRISDANLVSSALDQFYINNQRKFPIPAGGTSIPGSYTYQYSYIDLSSMSSSLGAYMSPLPKDPSYPDVSFKYTYLYDLTGRKAAIVVDKMENTSGCNTGGTLPEIVQAYKAVSPTLCYYVVK